MPVTDDMLSQPIDWQDPAFAAMLGDLQGNILKGHGRDHTLNYFLSFDRPGSDETRAALRVIGSKTTSALEQFNENEAFKLLGQDGGPAVFFFLTASGYQKLGKAPPAGQAFSDGMAARPLGDPDPAGWGAHLQGGIDAMLLVADDSVTKVGNAAARLVSGFAAAGIRVLGRDAGHALRSEPSPNDSKGRGLEHFGYVDGRSQPLMLTQDVARERDQNDGVDVWNPAFGPGEVALVRDPNGATPDSFGSFLVYRKLEQNVRGFKAEEAALATRLGLVDPDDERAGAMVVGRFEDGTPLIASPAAIDPAIVPNNFDYQDDPKGLKCPIHAHVRKVNPRGQLAGRVGDADEHAEQRTHLMPRRGIPFGDPARDFEDEASFPSGGVGLLFMAYNKSIETQFEVTQRFWANCLTFPATPHRST